MEKKRGRKLPDLTSGPIFKPLLLYALPMIFANLMSIFYQAADMMVVGLSDEVNAVGAIGTTTFIYQMIVNVFAGFGVGVTVTASRRFGTGDEEGVSKTLHTAVPLALISGGIVAVIGFFAAEPLLVWQGNEGAVLTLGTKYLQVMFLACPITTLAKFFSFFSRTGGDSRIVFRVSLESGILNILLNLLFVLGFGMDVVGVALTTALSQLYSCVAYYFFFRRSEGAFHFSWRKLRLDLPTAVNILRVGLPAAGSAIMYPIADMMVQSSIMMVNNSVITDLSGFQPVAAGNSAASSLEGFASATMYGVSASAIVAVGQTVGAKKYDRLPRLLFVSFALDCALSASFAALIFFCRAPLLALYGVEVGEEGSLMRIAFEAATTRMIWRNLFFCVYALMDIGAGFMRAMEKSVSEMVLAFFTICVFRIVWVNTVFPAIGTLGSIYVCFPISWAVCGVGEFILIAVGIRRLKKQKPPETV